MPQAFQSLLPDRLHMMFFHVLLCRRCAAWFLPALAVEFDSLTTDVSGIGSISFCSASSGWFAASLRPIRSPRGWSRVTRPSRPRWLVRSRMRSAPSPAVTEVGGVAGARNYVPCWLSSPPLRAIALSRHRLWHCPLTMLRFQCAGPLLISVLLVVHVNLPNSMLNQVPLIVLLTYFLLPHLQASPRSPQGSGCRS